MKYCPQCNRQYTEPWLTFCSDDGSLLIEELQPPVDPNWDPVIREPGYKPPPSEQETKWLPREPPMPGGWVAPDERAPMQPVWQPPPAPPQPVKQQTQGLAVASMIIGIIGLLFGCFGPLTGVLAVVLGWLALAQMKKTPDTSVGKPMAIIGIVTGAATIIFYGLLFLLFFGGVFGS